jgi:hypothetical protein
MSEQKPVGWRHDATDGVEEVWAFAEVEWLTAEEPPDVWESTTFDGLGEDGECYMGIALDHPVQPGNVTISPIEFYAAQHPIEQLLQVGATFRVDCIRLPEQRDQPVARGKVVSVQRCHECLPGTPFRSLLAACRTPTAAVIRQALGAREQLSETAGDHLSYMAGFTHYPEAAPVLSEFAMCVSGRPPRLIDARRRTVHFKILLQDYQLPGLDTVPIARRYGSPIFNNSTLDRYPDGNWVTEKPPLPTYQDYLKWAEEIEWGMLEKAQTFRGPNAAPDGSRIVFSTGRVEALNVVTNIDRMFCNVSAVIASASGDAATALSFQQLAAYPQVWDSMAKAFWLLVETDHLRIATDLLDRIGAEYQVVPEDETRDDYLEQVMGILTERLR